MNLTGITPGQSSKVQFGAAKRVPAKQKTHFSDYREFVRNSTPADLKVKIYENIATGTLPLLEDAIGLLDAIVWEGRIEVKGKANDPRKDFKYQAHLLAAKSAVVRKDAGEIAKSLLAAMGEVKSFSTTKK